MGQLIKSILVDLLFLNPEPQFSNLLQFEPYKSNWIFTCMWKVTVYLRRAEAITRSSSDVTSDSPGKRRGLRVMRFRGRLWQRKKRGKTLTVWSPCCLVSKVTHFSISICGREGGGKKRGENTFWLWLALNKPTLDALIGLAELESELTSFFVDISGCYEDNSSLITQFSFSFHFNLLFWWTSEQRCFCFPCFSVIHFWFSLIVFGRVKCCKNQTIDLD